MEELSRELALFRYNPAWLEYNFIDAAFLHNQVDYWRTGSDPNTEHYRYAAFRHVLASRSKMNEAEIAHYIHLAENDADQAMAQSALIELLLWSELTDAQFDLLAHHPAYQKPEHQKQVRRQRLFNQLNNSPLTQETFDGCLASEDTTIQRELVSLRQLTREQLQILAERGSSRAIRNMAKVRIR